MMLRITRMMVTKKPVAKESTKETVKPLRREGRTASAEPVCSCASLSKSCTRDRGCSAHPAFPAPLLSRAGRIWQNSGEWRRENAKSYSIFNCRRRACGDQYSRALVMESKSCAYRIPAGACHRARRRRDPVAGMTAGTSRLKAGTTESLLALRFFRHAIETILHLFHLTAELVH